MLRYWQFRIRIYHESLKQWLDSLRQISTGLVALFPLALPALILIPLLALGVLADSTSNNPLYLNTLWGYLLLLYSWMALQRDGIQARQYQLYIDSLPISAAKRHWCELGIILYGANIFVLGPLLLVVVMFFHQLGHAGAASISALLKPLLPITALLFLSGYYSLSAVQGVRPWLSLLLLPLIASSWANELVKGQWLIIWFAAIVVERQLPGLRVTLGSWPSGFYRLLLQADMDNPRNEGLRWVALLLLLILATICIQGVEPQVQPYIANLLSFVSAILIASSLFDVQAVRRQYQLYLASLPDTLLIQRFYGVAYVMFKTLPAVLLISYLQLFTSEQWCLWSLFYTSSLLGIHLRPKWFLFFPLGCALLVFFKNQIA
ncbi:DUF6136 family protein [Neptunicella sp. SCSIO 80796]|uniref:DUF6136 family protein n=1 Tax=Neptunicella plasticusilytica TaxID=3117012 RepID=UPI003A4D956C